LAPVSNQPFFISAGAFSHSRSALLMCVCQPAPLSLNAPTTSVFRRILTCSFGFAEAGRPRLGLSISRAASLPSSSASTSPAERALANHSAVASDASSGVPVGSQPDGLADLRAHLLHQDGCAFDGTQCDGGSSVLTGDAIVM